MSYETPKYFFFPLMQPLSFRFAINSIIFLSFNSIIFLSFSINMVQREPCLKGQKHRGQSLPPSFGMNDTLTINALIDLYLAGRNIKTTGKKLLTFACKGANSRDHQSYEFQAINLQEANPISSSSANKFIEEARNNILLVDMKANVKQRFLEICCLYSNLHVLKGNENDFQHLKIRSAP